MDRGTKGAQGSPLHIALKDSPYLLVCLHTLWRCSWVNSDVALSGQTAFWEGFPAVLPPTPKTSPYSRCCLNTHMYCLLSPYLTLRRQTQVLFPFYRCVAEAPRGESTMCDIT